MGTEAERQDTRKAMAFDLCNLIDENEDKEVFTKDEITEIKSHCFSSILTLSLGSHVVTSFVVTTL